MSRFHKTSFEEEYTPPGLCSVVAIGAAAAIGGAAISADASRSASNKAADASRDAASAQMAMQQKAIDLQKPWYDAGQGANARLSAGLAKGGEFNAPEYTAMDPSKIASDPGYQFTLKEAMKSTENQRSAKGGGLGGNALTALQDRAAGVASTKFNDAFTQNLQSWQAKMAQNTANVGNLQKLSNSGQVASGASSQLESESGATAAAGILGSANPYGGVKSMNAGLSTAGSIFGAVTSPQGQQAMGGLSSFFNGSSAGGGGEGMPTSYTTGSDGAVNGSYHPSDNYGE